MLPHILLCFLLGVSMIFEHSKNNESFFYVMKGGKIKFDKKFILFLLIPIVFYALTDVYWGVDQEEYEIYFYQASVISNFSAFFSSKYELFSAVFHVLSKLISYVTWDFASYKVLLLVMQLLIVAYVLYKNCNNKIMCMLTFLMLNASLVFFCQRQMTAFSFFLLAYDAWINKKIRLSIFLFLLAVAFHQIALVGIIAFVLINFKKRLTGLKTLTILLCVNLLSSNIIAFLIRNYKFGVYQYVTYGNGGGYNLLVLQFVVILMLDFYIRKRNVDNAKIDMYYNMYIVACSLQFFAIKFSVLNRTRMFYIWPLGLIFSELIDGLEIKNNKMIARFFLWLILSLYYLYTFAIKYPYEFIGG